MLSKLALFTLLPAAVFAQTYTSCNPLQNTCPADPALGGAATIDFTQGASKYFSANGVPTYNGNGVSFTVAKSGDSPQLNSNFYIMFGHVDVVMKAAPGQGIVSSVVLESDDLDEIDWEWIGSDDTHAQTNYFGKGITGDYNRGKTLPANDVTGTFHTWSIDWTASAVTWLIDGAVVRTLAYADASGGAQFPQTPMQLKIGAWSGGDSKNPPGTITWAGGPTNYGTGPYSMLVKSVSVTDYSTGKSYSYGDHSGTWQSIKSDGGVINSGPGKVGTGNAAGSSSAQQSATTTSSAKVNAAAVTTSATLTTVTSAASITPAVLATQVTAASAVAAKSTGAASALSLSAGSAFVGLFAALAALF